MKIYGIAAFLFCACAPIIAVAQRSPDSLIRQQNTVMTVDMSVPHSSSVTVVEYDNYGNRRERRGLSQKSSNTLQVRLINCNPFKYQYAIETDPVVLFEKEHIADSVEKAKEELPKAELQQGTTAWIDTAVNAAVAAAIASIKSSDNVVTSAELLSAVRSNTQVDGSVSDAAKQLSLELANTLPQKKKLTMPDVKALMIRAGGTVNTKMKLVEKRRIREMDTLIRKVLSLSQETESLYNKALRLKTNSEDFMDTEKFKMERDELIRHFDETISRYHFMADEIDAFDTTGMGRRNINRLEKLKVSLAKTIHNISELEQQLNKLQTEYFTRAIDVNGQNIDALEVKVKRTPLANTAVSDLHAYKIWMKGGIKIDASAGIFVSSLVDRKYFTIDSTVNDTVANTQTVYKKIMPNDIGPLVFGFGSNINFSLRTGAAWAKPSINFGIMLTTASTQKFQFLASGGLILGKEQRGILHFGATLGTVTVLQKGYEEYEQSGRLYALGTNNVPTEERFSIGYFFGFTYNISKIKIEKDIMPK